MVQGSKETDAAADEVARLRGELAYLKERFEGLIERLDAVGIQGYNPDGTITLWNRFSSEIYGYSEEEAVGRNLLDLIIPPEMQDSVRAAIAAGAQGEPMPGPASCYW